jgi:hypothetical protein
MVVETEEFDARAILEALKATRELDVSLKGGEEHSAQLKPIHA